MSTSHPKYRTAFDSLPQPTNEVEKIMLDLFLEFEEAIKEFIAKDYNNDDLFLEDRRLYIGRLHRYSDQVEQHPPFTKLLAPHLEAWRKMLCQQAIDWISHHVSENSESLINEFEQLSARENIDTDATSVSDSSPQDRSPPHLPSNQSNSNSNQPSSTRRTLSLIGPSATNNDSNSISMSSNSRKRKKSALKDDNSNNNTNSENNGESKVNNNNNNNSSSSSSNAHTKIKFNHSSSSPDSPDSKDSDGKELMWNSFMMLGKKSSSTFYSNSATPVSDFSDAGTDPGSAENEIDSIHSSQASTQPPLDLSEEQATEQQASESDQSRYVLRSSSSQRGGRK